MDCHQTFVNSASWYKDELVGFGVRRSKFKLTACRDVYSGVEFQPFCSSVALLSRCRNLHRHSRITVHPPNFSALLGAA